MLFSSKDLPGTISDHLVVTPKLIAERRADVQKIVNAWYDTLEWIKANPAEATAIMAEHAQLSPADYSPLADGTKLFSAADAIKGYTGKDPTDLTAMFWQVDDFLMGTGLIKNRASLEGLYDPSFTQEYLKAHGGDKQYALGGTALSPYPTKSQAPAHTVINVGRKMFQVSLPPYSLTVVRGALNPG